MKKDNLLAPIRRRGAIRPERGPFHEEEEFFVEPCVGEIDHHLPAVSEQIGVLVEWLRKKSQLQLSVVVYGWASPQAQAFVEALRPHLAEEDSVWLVPAGVDAESVAEPEIERAVVLKGSRDSHRQTLANLPGDLVFFSAQSPQEVSKVASWKRRTRAIVAYYKEGNSANAILKAAALYGLSPCYLWDGEQLQ